MTSTDAGQFFSIKVDTKPVELVIHRAPITAYFWLRTFLMRAFIDHRLHWFKVKGTKFGRGGNGAIKVWEVNAGPESPGPNDVAYRVFPAERSMRGRGRDEAVRGLDQMRAEAFTGNNVLPVHEFGQDIRSGQLMAVPVKTRARSPKAFRAQNPDKLLVLRVGKRKGNLLLYEKLIPKKWLSVSSEKAAPRRHRAPVAGFERVRLRLRFILTRFIDMKPTLRMYQSWDDLVSSRSDDWNRVATRMVEDMANAVD